MRALLLAAGLGTRLRPITDSLPKCLVEIDGRPLLDYWIELLDKGGIADILVNLHYFPDVVRQFIESRRYPLNIAMVYEEELLGTAGTLLRNRLFFHGGPVMLIHADNLSLFDPRAFMERFYTRDSNIEITMMTFHTDAPESCGIVELDDRGTVRAFHEKIKKPPGNLANAAVYILAPTVLSFIAQLGKETVDFSTEVLPHFLGRINSFHNDVYHRDIGTVESLVIAQREYPAVVAKQDQGDTGRLLA
jgi:mannose-1-phosphate guanylyltransferase